ncbi:MAG TPA: DUF3153 domain-containing protein [Cyanobacteria bacterium UBA8803]|nr:DUF3153 domain-containing protein [Cyanobacteria bacterium UBA9273]HBL62839.1 DUF3153 domain-containing protein [Cyanobacteria bacterium UBA8803]
MTSAVGNLSPFIRRLLGRWRVVWIVLLAALLLSGCVKYDVAVNFNDEHHGAIVQHIRLGEQLTSFSNAQATEWLRSIEQRAKQLQGKTKRFSSQEIVVTVPFSNGEELAAKFNQFFNPVAAGSGSKKRKTGNLPSIDSKLNLKQHNFFVVQQNQLSYELDLRSLAVLAANGSAIVSPGSLLDLHFSLETPWGAKTIGQTANTINPKSYNNGHKLVWTLIPGQLNRLEVVFWLPSPLGIGTIVIVVLVLSGFYVKYKSFPWIPEQNLSETSPLSVN